MKKSMAIAIRIASVLAGIAIVFLGRGFFFYSGSYSAPPAEIPGYEKFDVPPAPTTEFSDVYEEGKGVILIDLAHNNAFDKEELNVLILRLISRGLTIKFLSAPDDLEKELLGEVEEEESLDEEPLVEEPAEIDQREKPLLERKGEKEEAPRPNAFIVISPQKEFSKDETDNVTEFVARGGKLLLMADPTRYGKMNSLSLDFGLLFEPDYLYNMKENEINYQNIFVTEFEEHELTENLKKIVLYTAGSISSANSSIAFVDENTFSNRIETRKRLSPITLAQEGKVLAIYDLTFITEPYNGILDNNRFISNVADWLMSPTPKTESK
ncbi:MAG: hypothetical protein HYU85_02910 [Chloroflexi bacterium]|nr:hypothetical protein [Chloroflexota bacterium]